MGSIQAIWQLVTVNDYINYQILSLLFCKMDIIIAHGVTVRIK